jgi:hypothetical protein
VGGVLDQASGLHFVLGEDAHLKVDGENPFGGRDEVVRLRIDDDDVIGRSIPAEVGIWHGEKALGFKQIADHLVGGRALFFKPRLRNHHRGFAGWLADDHAWLVRNRDALEAEVVAEDFILQGHAEQILGGSGVAATKFAVLWGGDLPVKSGPCAFDGPVVGSAVVDLVFAR